MWLESIHMQGNHNGIETKTSPGLIFFGTRLSVWPQQSVAVCVCVCLHYIHCLKNRNDYRCLAYQYTHIFHRSQHIYSEYGIDLQFVFQLFVSCFTTLCRHTAFYQCCYGSFFILFFSLSLSLFLSLALHSPQVCNRQRFIHFIFQFFALPLYFIRYYYLNMFADFITSRALDRCFYRHFMHMFYVYAFQNMLCAIKPNKNTFESNKYFSIKYISSTMV